MRFVGALHLAVTAAAICTACGAPRSPQGAPRIGILVRDTAGSWCAAFANDSAGAIGRSTGATIVFAGSPPPVSRRVRIIGQKSSLCATAFPQPRWESYTAYEIEPVDPIPADSTVPAAGLIIAGDTRWTSGTPWPRADIDDDGTPEEVRRCAADEGEHFTVWSIPRSGPPVRRWHEYFDWGALVDVTCKAGEDGRDVAK